MLSPIDLQNMIVDLLRAMPELVAILGDVASVEAYDDESQIAGNPDTAQLSMMGRAVLVIWDGAEMPRMGETRGWRHSFKIAIKAESIQAYHNIVQAIIDGIPSVPAGDEINSFLNSTIHPDCDGIQDVQLQPERSADGIGRLSISFSVHEK